MLSLPLRPPPSSPRGGEEEGWEEGKGRAPQHRRFNRRNPVPARRRDVCVVRRCSSDHYGAVYG